MSKKSHRSNAKHHAKSAKPIQAKHPQQLKPAVVKSQSPVRVSLEAQDSTSRYQYIKPELKRIGILAGSMILILIVLSFVL